MLKKIIIALTMCFAVVTMGYANPSLDANADTAVAATEVVEAAEVAEIAEVEEADEAEAATGMMNQAQKVENIKANDPHGFTITIMAMVIVVLALVVLFLLFLVFGKMSSRSQKKKKIEAKGLSNSDTSSEEADSGEVIAAIAMALAQHFDAHEAEDTVLTIKRMKRAYSPWNSKIYNMREIPQVNKK